MFLFSLKKIIFFLILGSMFFVPSVVWAEPMPICPGYTDNPDAESQGNYSKTMEDEDPKECEVPEDLIQIAVPIPGLKTGTIKYYPVEYRTYTKTDGEQQWCYVRPLKQCYTVSGIQEYIRWLYSFLVSAIGIVSVGMIMYGAVQFITAYGVAEKIQKAKDTIINSILGLVIALLSYVILFTINPAITSLYIPSIPPVPPVANPLEAEALCATTCGEVSDAATRGTDEIKKCMGVLCPTKNQSCVIERSPSNPDKYSKGSCVSEYLFTYMNHSDSNKNNKSENFPFDGDIDCGTVQKETVSHDDVGSKCASPKTPNTCHYVIPVSGHMKVDYSTDPPKVSNTEGTKSGCF